MLKRQKKIIEHLVYSEKGVTGSVLSNRLSVSVRTIRNDISAINSEYQKTDIRINADKIHGYYIPKKDKQLFLEVLASANATENTLPTTPSERLIYLALKLLKETNFIPMETLAEILYVSKTTISNDIKKLTEIACDCKGLKIELKVSPLKGILLKGEESQKRLFIFQIINTFYSHNLHVFKNILKLFDINFDNDFFTIYNAFVLYLDTHNIALADNELNVLVLETVISIYRIGSNFDIEADYQSISDNDLSEVFDEIQKNNTIELEPLEKRFISDCLAFKRVLIIDNDGNDMIHDDAKYIVKAFIEEIHKQYQINLLITDSFVKNFSIHISSMINRIKVRSYDDSSVAGEIKMTYPFAFELATNIIPIIKKVTGEVINETELSYIAVYLAVILEQMKNKKNIVIVCGSGLGTAQLIVNRLEAFFYNEINILGYYPLYKIDKVIKERKSEIDMILSTIPFSFKTKVPIIRISPLFTQEDINKLHGMLHGSKNTIRSKTDSMFTSLSVFDRNLFKLCENNVSHAKILCDLTQLLVDFDYIDNKSGFIESVLQREMLYSTRYGKIGIPHPMENMSNDTTAAIAIVNTDKIKLIVFLLAINAKQYDKFHFLYGKIINLMDSNSKIESSLNVTNFDELIAILDNPE